MSIIVSDLSYHYVNQNPLFENISFSVTTNMKVAIVGNNGVGKSTLLQLISGVLDPVSGTICCTSVPYYVAQQATLSSSLSVGQALSVERKLTAIKAITSGSTLQAHYDALANDWQIQARCESALAKWNLSGLSLDSSVERLSGGQRAKLYLAGLMVHCPSIILLDEPTNHLDNPAREMLYEYIRNIRATVVVVSHDREFLNRIDTIFELTTKGVRRYGGNYDFYRTQKELDVNALNESIEHSEKCVREARQKAQQVRERQQKRDNRGERNKDQIVPIMRKTVVDRAQSTARRLNDKHAKIIRQNTEQLSELRALHESNCVLKIDFDDARLHTGKLLVMCTGVNYEYVEGKPLWGSALDFGVYSGQRIHVQGDNGTGKTTLIRLLTGEITPNEGRVVRSDFSYVYMDQCYSPVSVDVSVLELAQKYNCDNLEDHQIKMRLHRALFDRQMWDRRCVELSAGEKMRLYLCCLMISNHVPDMFILDEPTNNLDLASLRILTQTIKNYRGTLIVISHDRAFVEDVGITDEIFLKCR